MFSVFMSTSSIPVQGLTTTLLLSEEKSNGARVGQAGNRTW